MTLSPPWRKALLTVHVLTAVGWLGADLGVLALSLAGARGTDPAMVYPAIGLLGTAVLLPLSVATWGIGLLNGLLTRWGLLLHWWVTVKLVMTTVMLGLMVFVLRPTLSAASELGAALPAEQREQLLIAPTVSLALLTAATVLSTYKPWGRTRRGTVTQPRSDRTVSVAP